MSNKSIVKIITSNITQMHKNHPTRICIDGVDCSGKTYLASSLKISLEQSGHKVIRASIDGFHNPSKIRYKRGDDSAEGYYLDSFDYDALRANLLKPLGPKGERYYRSAVYNFHSESCVNEESKLASPQTILVFDGVFLLRPELRGYWEYCVLLHTDFSIVLSRAAKRDRFLFGSSQRVIRRYRNKYIPGQKTYLTEAQPYLYADIVINNNDYNRPELVTSIDERCRLQDSLSNFT